MSALIDLIGKEFGTLRVTERAPSQSANPRKIRSAKDVIKMLKDNGIYCRETAQVAETVAYKVYNKQRPGIFKKLNANQFTPDAKEEK